MRLGIAGIGVIAPGMDAWLSTTGQSAKNILQGQTVYTDGSGLAPMSPTLLPANERRRTTPLIKLALCCAQQVLIQIDPASINIKAKNLASVFASSCGDLQIVDLVMNALLMEGKPVSPTHFHNSVHNAPAGYCSIATGSHAASTSLSAFDDSFAVGLLEAATQVIVEQQDVLLVAYDMPPPPVLSPFRPMQAAFATALILTHENADHLHAVIDLEISNERQISQMSDVNLENLRAGNPAARSLPLLQLLAREEKGTVYIPYPHAQSLQIALSPC